MLKLKIYAIEVWNNLWHPEAFVGKLRKIWIGEEVKKQSQNQKQCEGFERHFKFKDIFVSLRTIKGRALVNVNQVSPTKFLCFFIVYLCYFSGKIK